jgi:predicted nucleic acid-binding protein
VHQHCRDLAAASRLITDLPQVRVVERDPNGDMVIACALQARADYIVTRDKDLLSLGSYEGIRIVRPRQFLDLLDASGAG